MNGLMPGRKIDVDSLNEVRQCLQVGGTLVLWEQIERSAQDEAHNLNVDIDDYFYYV